MNYFNSKVIWITGASSGIGEALAYQFSAQGALLLLSSRREEELLRVRNACAYPEQVKILPIDLLDSGSIGAQTLSAIAQFGHIDICILNAGISQRSLVVETSLEVHRKVMELDYFSCVEVSRHLLPHFLNRKSGHFVAMSSVMGKLGTPMRSSYAAAKHAIHGFFDCLRSEVSGGNIKVTILTPGYIRTNISLNALKGDGSRFDNLTENIKNGLPADKAAQQMARAIAGGKYESFIGRFGAERIALWINRFFPSFIIKRAPTLTPK
jgi:dehydrogenase/reductase SDR family protein 7B